MLIDANKNHRMTAACAFLDCYQRDREIICSKIMTVEEMCISYANVESKQQLMHCIQINQRWESSNSSQNYVLTNSSCTKDYDSSVVRS